MAGVIPLTARRVAGPRKERRESAERIRERVEDTHTGRVCAYYHRLRFAYVSVLGKRCGSGGGGDDGRTPRQSATYKMRLRGHIDSVLRTQVGSVIIYCARANDDGGGGRTHTHTHTHTHILIFIYMYMTRTHDGRRGKIFIRFFFRSKIWVMLLSG